MSKIRPIHGLLCIPLFVAALFLITSGRSLGAYERISPDSNGQVRVSVGELGKGEVDYYRFLNSGNQEVKFFVGRDRHGIFQVAFDASESHSIMGRGFEHQGGWMVDNKCGTAIRLEQINSGGKGCRPVPLPHRLEGDQVVLAETDILRGWRLFN